MIPTKSQFELEENIRFYRSLFNDVDGFLKYSDVWKKILFKMCPFNLKKVIKNKDTMRRIMKEKYRLFGCATAVKNRLYQEEINPNHRA